MNKLKTGLLSIALVTSLSACSNKAEQLVNPSQQLLDTVVPFNQPAIEFARQNEQLALSKGEPLNQAQLAIANRIGIKESQKIRVLYVDTLPFPEDKLLAQLAKRNNLESPYMLGFTYGYGIFIKKPYKTDLELLAHELVHVSQYETLGIDGFIKRYLLELAVMGYRQAPLEVEAYNNARSFL